MTHPNRIIRQDIEAIVGELEPVLRSLAGTTLLVTGGSGFLCSYFPETVAYCNDHCWDRPCRMVVVDNLKSGLARRLRHLMDRSDFQFIKHDVSRRLTLERPVDWLIHGASIASPTFYRQYPLETIDANVGGTRQMLELARRQNVRGMLYLSTSEVYGDPHPDFIPTPEDYRGNVSCTGPRACYDESKRLAETLCMVYHDLHGISVKIVRPFNVYGPGQRLDDKRIIPDLMSVLLDFRPIVLFSDGRATRSFCYISDAIRVMWRVLLTGIGGNIFNVGNDQEEISMTDLVQRARQVAGLPELPIEHRTSADRNYLTDNPQRRCPDLSKLRGHFPWEPRVSLSEGLARTLLSYRDSGPV